MADRADTFGWDRALERYDDLIRDGWLHLAPMRQLIFELQVAEETRGLTAVTSMDRLLLSPYTCYPDWFEGRHVLIAPLWSGKVQVSWHPERFCAPPTKVWLFEFPDVHARVLRLAAEL